MPDPEGYVVPSAIDIPSQAAVASPPSGTRRVYVDSGATVVAVRTSGGLTYDIENSRPLTDSTPTARVTCSTSTPHVTITGDVNIDSGDLKMATAGKAIKDSGGTARITLATASPHVTLTGEVHATSKLAVGTVAPSASSTLEVSPTLGSLTANYNVINLASSVTAGAASLSFFAISGQLTATVPDATTLTAVRGLQFTATAQTTAASSTGTVSSIYGVNVTSASLAVGSGRTLNVTEQVGVRSGLTFTETASGTVVVTNAYAFAVVSPTTSGSPAITTMYGYHCPALSDTDITNRIPFFDGGVGTGTGDTNGNVFVSNTQLFSSTKAFGTGQGVLGIRDAVTVPSTNPANGGVLYATAGTLVWRGSAGTVTVLAVA